MHANDILDELYATRDRIWKDCGESMTALCDRYSVRRPGVVYLQVPEKSRVSSNRRRPSRAASKTAARSS